MEPDVCVIIPCFAAEPVIAPQLQALARQQGAGSFQVVLSDNGRNPNLAAVARDAAPTLDVVIADATAESGTAYARNMGMHVASAEKLLFCDADDIVGPTWVRAGAQMLDEVPVFSGGAVPFTAEELDRPLDAVWETLAERLGPYLEDAHDMPAGTYPVLLGCSFGIQRQFARYLGGFDRAFGRQAEDNDLAFRAQAAYGSLPRAAFVSIAYRVRPPGEVSLRRAFDSGFRHAELCAKHDAWTLSPSFQGRWAVRPFKEAMTEPLSPYQRCETLARVLGLTLGSARYRLLPSPEPRLGIDNAG